MAKMIQVRNVPDKMHRELVRRAKRRGTTLTDYIKAILEREIERPPVDEVLDRIATRARIEGFSGAEAVRASRQEREAELERRR